MKKLIFNGCSYTAGDACSWDEFSPEIPWTAKIWTAPQSDKLIQKYAQYRIGFRPNRNLGAICSKMLDTEKIDLSQDGNVNSRIALETINYILSLQPDERTQYHVCIGWTETSRRLRWNPQSLKLECLHVAHLNHKGYSNFKNYIKEEIVLSTDADHTINYIKDVMLLENFLKSQGMTYTFWRALGGQPHIPSQISALIRIDEHISSNENWVAFNQEDPLRVVGSAWADTLHRWSDFISEENGHPNMNSIVVHASRVCEHIIKYS